MLVIAAALLFTASAAADGDPASDVLLSANVYLPYPAPSSTASQELAHEVARVYANGYRLKVAVIATETDLGAIPSLFGKPGKYAQFLGEELAFVYIGPLLIVMPAGYGVYDGGRSTAAESRVLAHLSVGGSSADELTNAAASTVRKLLDAGALESRDVKPPYTYAVAAHGKAGHAVRLEYDVYDDSGRSKVTIRVKAASRVLATFHATLRSASALKRYHVAWKIPAPLPTEKLSFCVTASDAARNHSKPICARIFVP
jgi:hypothetical protein